MNENTVDECPLSFVFDVRSVMTGDCYIIDANNVVLCILLHCPADAELV